VKKNVKGGKEIVTSMIKKKICLLGVSAVGKTSLVRQYVHSIFTDKYHSTLGVKIDTKSLDIHDTRVELLIWDIHGDEDYKPIHLNYLKGSAGFLLVADGTRANTLQRAMQIKEKVFNSIGEIPFVILLNKADLIDDWDILDEDIQELKSAGWFVLYSSAKTGEGVEEAFYQLASEVVTGQVDG